MKKSLTIVVAVIVIALAVGGGLYFMSRPATRQITLQAFDFFFLQPGVTGNNPTITVKSGDTVILTIQNLASKDHELMILTKQDYDSYYAGVQSGQRPLHPHPEAAFKEAEVEDVEPGESKTGTFVVGQPGTYVYACLEDAGTIPLTHAHEGMFGTFIVQSGGIFTLTNGMTEWLGNVSVVHMFQAYLIAAASIATTFFKQAC